MKDKVILPVGRFAPSPTGRMHIGNLYAALISYLSAKSRGGRWILRIEDLDPGRSRREYARQIEDDLLWLGLEWDEGGLDNEGPRGPYVQSERGVIYGSFLQKLADRGLTYPCYCTRSDLFACGAPHQCDGRIVYPGTCRPPYQGKRSGKPKTRLIVPDKTIAFTDRIAGPCSFNLARECGDFIVRRADGAWAYQLAVVIDDALMGVTEVVRGDDLLLSTAQQKYLYNLLEFKVPEFAHFPLLRNEAGQRLSKRDRAESMEELRKKHTPEELLGRLGFLIGLLPSQEPAALDELIERFSQCQFSDPSRRDCASI